MNYQRAKWTLDDGRVIHLLTLPDFERLADGTKLYSINGDVVVKGVDHIDLDTRHSFLAFGVEPD